LSENLAVNRAATLPGKLAYYSRDLLQAIHLKYKLANLMCGILPDDASGPIRTWLYRKIGLDVTHGAFIISNMRLVSGMEGFYDKLHIGSGTVIGSRVTINLDGEVTLGTNVSIGPDVIIYTGTHPLGPGSQRRLSEIIARPVKIEDGCWIGLAATILPGVTIGHGSVVAAGAVVSQDVPPDSYVEGNPGRVIKQLPWSNR